MPQSQFLSQQGALCTERVLQRSVPGRPCVPGSGRPTSGCGASSVPRGCCCG